jgi:hypothetical protein
MLCTIQSTNRRPNADWKIEPAKVGDVYRNTRLTLMALWPSHSDRGIFVPSIEIGAICPVMADIRNESSVIQRGATESDIEFVQTDCLSK